MSNMSWMYSAIVQGDALGRLDLRVADLAEPLGLLDPRLDLADAAQVLVELLRVLRIRAVAASSARRRGRSRGSIAAPAGGAPGSPAAGPACRFRRAARRPAAGSPPAASGSSASSTRGCTGRRTNTPSRTPADFRPESHASSSDGNRVRWPIRLRHHLVDRDPGPDVRGALLQPDAGQERRVAARMVAAAVGAADRPSGGSGRPGPGPGP